MVDSKIWKFLKEELKNNELVVLLVVVDAKGSSPGRAGFKLALAANGSSVGTIGGGIVEHSLVMEAQKMLQLKVTKPYISRQVHNPNDSVNSSGMICSGEQTVMIYPMQKSHLKVINKCLYASENFDKTHFVITQDLFEHQETSLKNSDQVFLFENEDNWSYKENLYRLENIYIFGGGHVCFALTELLWKLGFYITVYDDRKDLEMMQENKFVHKKIIASYSSVTDHLESNSEAYFLIMTHSHLNDAKVLAQLINKPHKYLGMLGSSKKVKEIYSQLEKNGIPREKLLKVHSPVGISINSKTVDEIAVSIAAELIKVKNG